MPIDLPEGEAEDRAVAGLVAWLTDAGQRLHAVFGGQTPPDDGEADGDPDDGGADDDRT